jgi:ABC-type nitrate/sulfonate/bicarbonate transport system substrate-binding protein
VVNALEQAMRLAHASPDTARKVAYAKFPEVEHSILDQAIQRMLDSETLPTSTALNRDGWHKAVQVRAQVGDLARPSEADTALADEYWQKAQGQE